MREWQRRAERLFAAKGRPLGPLYGDKEPITPPPFHFNSSLFHRHAHLLWIAYEGRQGYLGNPAFMPLPSEWEIVDDYLSAVTVFAELGAEGYYARANREAFPPEADGARSEYINSRSAGVPPAGVTQPWMTVNGHGRRDARAPTVGHRRPEPWFSPAIRREE